MLIFPLSERQAERAIRVQAGNSPKSAEISCKRPILGLFISIPFLSIPFGQWLCVGFEMPLAGSLRPEVSCFLKNEIKSHSL